MTAYYNEIDPYAAEWLRNLIDEGLIAPGKVDERSIADVSPGDLAGFTQCHFFAGIGIWSYSMRLAEWPDDRPVWTGSCPCQPFSSAGKGDEFADARHLWPAFFGLIRERRPVAVFGEQVASRDALAWLDHVCADLEGEGYAVGAVDSCAAGYGAPHIRSRLYWLADGRGNGSAASGVLGDAVLSGCSIRDDSRRERDLEREGDEAETRFASGATNDFWANAVWILCRDGKARPTEPGTSPLVNGAPSRVGRLRAYGNAICAPQAAEFIRAAMT